MQTFFTTEQLRNPDIKRSQSALRACVHCGMCLATCPTYQVLGDELDSPRGRIYLIKDMLEKERIPDTKTVHHLDRCLSCLACTTTCPAGVDYMHLIDYARAYIHRHYRRAWDDRALRWMLAHLLPYPNRFRAVLLGARLLRPLARFMPDARLRAMLDMTPKRIYRNRPETRPQVHHAQGKRKHRVALLTGCVQGVLNPRIHAATIRLLTRAGCDVVIAENTGCCGALTHHMGREADAHAFAARNIHAWMIEARGSGLDAIAINTSGCGVTLKNYQAMFAETELADDAAHISSMCMDISELIDNWNIVPRALQSKARPMRIAYHAACSLQHGQKITTTPKALLQRAGFTVVEPVNSHLCCGSAGVYNILQPKIATELQQRKVATLTDLTPEAIATGNIGCMTQIGAKTGIPVVHSVELLDWALGGECPKTLSKAGA